MAYVHDEYITSFLGVSVWPYYYDECDECPYVPMCNTTMKVIKGSIYYQIMNNYDRPTWLP